MRTAAAVLTGALAAGVSAENYLGFNSGATLADRSAKFKNDFLAEFRTAQNLEGAPGDFNAVRLYTNIQAYSETDPIQAFEAAIETKTKILLGIWASGTDNIDKELTALSTAIKNYGSKFTDLVIGMSVGSEDLYRDSQTGVRNDAGIGAGPEVIVKFIDDYKKAVQGTPLADVPIGHVDTWDVWGNSSNKIVIDAVDWVGVDEYPYYENDKGNKIERSGILFDTAFEATLAAAGGKPVWVTETGWPYVGPKWDEAVASVENAKFYWDEIGCRQLFNKVPTFWYNLRDSNPDNEMKFAITRDLSTKPLFNLTCPTTFETPKLEEASTTTLSRPAATTGSSTGTSSSPATATPGSGSGSGSGSNESGSDESGSGSGSGSNNSGSNNSGSNNSGSETAGDETTNTGSADTVTNTPPSAASGLMLSTITYAGLALVAGAFTLC